MQEKEFSVKFRLHDFKGFTAIIKNLETQTQNFKIAECYILWMIIGNPLTLSIFSPKNRDCQVNYFKKSIALEPNRLDHHIESPFPLPQRFPN